MSNLVKRLLSPIQEGLSNLPFINGRRTPYTDEEQYEHERRVAGYQGDIQRNKNAIKEIELGAEVMVTEIEKKETIAKGRTKVSKAEQGLIRAEGESRITELDTQFVRGETTHKVRKKGREVFQNLEKMNWHNPRGNRRSLD